MIEVFLHVGHGKTASSYLQSALALSVENLARNGIEYPDLNGTLARAKAGYTTSGNISLGQVPFRQAIESACSVTKKTKMLFSNEKMFHHLRRPEGREDLLALSDRGLRFNVLCFTRDPVGHMLSSYQQAVKVGATISVAEHMSNYAVPAKVAAFASSMAELPVTTSYFSYDRYKETLRNVLEEWLRLPKNTILEPPVRRVNRSLTRSEIALQLRLNEQLPAKLARVFAKDLCERVPDVRADRAILPKGELLSFLKRMRELTATANEVLPENARYSVANESSLEEFLESGSEGRSYDFGPDQLDTLAAVCNRIRTLR